MTAESKRRSAERGEFYMSWEGGDPWGSTMSHLFGIAEAVYAYTGEAWEEFTPSPVIARGELPDEYPDRMYYDDIASSAIDLDKLHHWYRVLLRYDALLRHHRYNY
jgi:hypothetical protein